MLFVLYEADLDFQFSPNVSCIYYSTCGILFPMAMNVKTTGFCDILLSIFSTLVLNLWYAYPDGTQIILKGYAKTPYIDQN
jgi:hypothetical protein